MMNRHGRDGGESLFGYVGRLIGRVGILQSITRLVKEGRNALARVCPGGTNSEFLIISFSCYTS